MQYGSYSHDVARTVGIQGCKNCLTAQIYICSIEYAPSYFYRFTLYIQLEYVRYGIEMKMETHKAIRSQHKTIEETKIIKMM